ncbi:unnamed protein product [Lupinus luteus]|uniref:Uncharacterized protein n=1 Tax=Lupinus luteus TaxID=3873 RepID=A0AAV1YML5_LUPLU
MMNETKLLRVRSCEVVITSVNNPKLCHADSNFTEKLRTRTLILTPEIHKLLSSME